MTRYEVWRQTTRGAYMLEKTFKHRWAARLWAWEHRMRGWFHYEVRAK